FAAALFQRLDRHKEAIEQYQAALRLATSAGIWWLGLGISFQAVEQPKEALEAFTRANSAGNLAPDLLGFVEQRLRQLQYLRSECRTAIARSTIVSNGRC